MENESLREKLVRLSDELAEDVYPLTLKFPKIEQYALADQLRRSVISVPANIIEGFARGSSQKEVKRFVDIAYGSLAEAKYLLYFASKRRYIKEDRYSEIKEKADKLSKLLWSLIRRIKS